MFYKYKSYNYMTESLLFLSVLCLFHFKASAAILCNKTDKETVTITAVEIADIQFRPTLGNAQIRAVDARLTPQKPSEYFIKKPEEYIDSLSRNQSRYGLKYESVQQLVWYIRFHNSVKVRQLAIFKLLHSKEDFATYGPQLVAAEIYEINPTVKKILSEHIEHNKKTMENRHKLESFNRTRLNQMSKLPKDQAEVVWKLLTQADGWYNKTRIGALVEQIPAEIQWLQTLKNNLNKSSAAKADYELALEQVLKRRQELSQRFLADQLYKHYLREQVEFIEAHPSSINLNKTKFKDYHPPFSPELPYVLIRVVNNESIKLARAYGGEAYEGGAWFFPARDGYLKSSIEARDTGALPDANTVELWKSVNFGKGEEFYLGSINPQYTKNGEPIENFGTGGLGGDIQYWRDPIKMTANGPEKKPYFTKEQTGRESVTLQDPNLRLALVSLRLSAKEYDNNNFFKAFKIYTQVKGSLNIKYNKNLELELKVFEKDMIHFHRIKYINKLNSILDQSNIIPIDSYNRLYHRGEKAHQKFSERDEKMNPIRSKAWRESVQWSNKKLGEFNLKNKEYFKSKKSPSPITID